MILQLIHVFQTTGIIEKHFNLKFHQMGNSEKINVSIILLRGHPHITSPPWGGGGVCKMMTHDDRGRGGATN